MKLKVIAVGRVRTDFFRAGCEEYAARLRHFHTLEVREIRDGRRKGGRADRWRREEADAILAARSPGAALVTLDERGRTFTSAAFAEWLRKQRDDGVGEIAFAIGGPDGLDASVRKAATQIWAFGPLTLPHELARLVLLEQLYRASTILAGHPYHR